MDILNKTVTVEKCVRIGGSQALIEGNARLPEGMQEIGSILETSALCEPPMRTHFSTVTVLFSISI